MKSAIAAFMAAAAMAVVADDMIDPDLPIIAKADRRTELKDRVPVCIHSAWCDGFQRRWRDVPTDSLEPLPQEKCDEMSDRYIAHCRKNADERPRGVEAWIDLGDALIFRDRWAEAEDAYAKAVANSKVKDLACSRALYGVAEAQFGAGRTNDCLETLKELSTYVNAKNKKGSAVDMYTWQKENSVPVRAAEKMSSEQLKGKIITGIFRDVQEPEYTEEYDKIIQKAGGR